MGWFNRSTKKEKAVSPVGNRGWMNLISEPFAGAWERNQELSHDNLLQTDVIFSCVTLVASDISKLSIETMQRDENRILRYKHSPAFNAVLRNPNEYQNSQQFLEKWVLSKIGYGNTYVLKVYNQRGTVSSLHVLDPTKVRPAVGDDGAVFYQVTGDRMNPDLPGYAREDGSYYIPARFIIHDRYNCLYHPLVGVSPITACALSAQTNHRIQQHGEQSFKNNLRPGGMLTVPAHLTKEQAQQLNTDWENKFSNGGDGKLAVMSDGAEYTPIQPVSPVDAQMVELSNLSAESICRVFHIPSFLVGVGTEPNYSGIEARTQSYYSQALQYLIEAIETCLEKGLNAGQDSPSGVVFKFDLDSLFRMDSGAKMSFLKEGVGGGIMAPNEARRRLDLSPVDGGDSVYFQQQNYSLEALARRDSQVDPFDAGTTPPAQAEPEPDDTDAAIERALAALKEE